MAPPVEEDQMKRAIYAGAIALAVTACGDRAGVQGTMSDTQETLTGRSEEQLGGTGTLYLTTAGGVSCTAPFVYKTQREAAGTLQCSDGRTGSVELVTTGKKGSGKGTLGGRPFTLVLG